LGVFEIGQATGKRPSLPGEKPRKAAAVKLAWMINLAFGKKKVELQCAEETRTIPWGVSKHSERPLAALSGPLQHSSQKSANLNRRFQGEKRESGS